MMNASMQPIFQEHVQQQQSTTRTGRMEQTKFVTSSNQHLHQQQRLVNQNQCINILMIVRILLTYLEKVDKSVLLRAKAVCLFIIEIQGIVRKENFAQPCLFCFCNGHGYHHSHSKTLIRERRLGILNINR